MEHSLIKPDFDFSRVAESITNEADEIIKNLDTGNGKWLELGLKQLVSQTNTPPKPDTVCYLSHLDEPYPLLTRGSISTFTGKAKAGKTTVLALLIANVLTTKRVLWIDTEQGTYYASITQHYILKCAGIQRSDNLRFFDLRQFSPKDRLQIIQALLKHQQYDLIILDGVRDIVYDINNPEEATISITQLMTWSVEFNIHIAMVLHQNKGNTDVRGHLGTEAINKSEIVISVTKTDTDAVHIIPEYCRGMPFEGFYVTRDFEGVPFINQDYSATIKKSAKGDLQDLENYRKYQILTEVFSNGKEFKYASLVSQIKIAFKNQLGKNLGDNKIKDFITECKNKGWVNQEAEKLPYTLGKYE